MAKTVAYIRISTQRQDVIGQRHEILEAANHRHLHVDEWMEVELSSRKSDKARRIDELKGTLQTGDTLVVTELSRLGRSTGDVVNLVRALMGAGVRVIVLKQNLDLTQAKNDMTSKILVTVFSMLAELERDLISSRTREALAAKKAAGVRLGKPMGTVQGSKFDADREKIELLLRAGHSRRKVARVLGYPNPVGLGKYLKRRGIADAIHGEREAAAKAAVG
jgi:DNA invertase Pin-like site-specific DNA recombinase